MASIQETLSVISPSLNPIILVLYKTSAPTTEVARIVKPAPHSTPFNYLFPDLTNGNYLINAHWSPDGVTLGTLIADHWSTAKTESAGYGVRQFRVGIDVADGDTEFHDTNLVGANLLVLYEEGTRPLFNGVEWEPISTGGVRLLLGKSFIDGQTWTIQYARNIIVDAPIAGGSEFTEFLEFDSSVTLGSPELNKVIVGTAIGISQNFGIPDASAVASGGYVFMHDGLGNLINIRVTPTSGTIRFKGANRLFIDIAKGEHIKILKTPSGWRAMEAFGGWDKVGTFELVRIPTDTQRQADGSELLNGLDYRRIYEHIKSLPADRVITTNALWNAQATYNGQTKYVNRGKFFLDVSTNTFRLPDMRGKYAWAHSTGTPGDYYPWTVGGHTHGLPIQDFGSTDRQSMVVNANADEGISEANRSGSNDVAGTAQNHVERIGFIGVINL